MLKWLLRVATERERQRTLLEALDTRVRQLERERVDLQIEHAERVDKLDALLRRMATRAQRAEGVTASRTTQPPLLKGEPKGGTISALEFRQDLTRRRNGA